MCASLFVVSLLLIGTAIGGEEKQAKLRFYHHSMKNYTELPLDEAEKIFFTSWYDPNKSTVVFTHGFTGHPEGPAVTAVITAYLEQGKCNVALLNWARLAALALQGVVNSYLYYAVPNAIQLGSDFAETLLKLHAAGLDLNNTHFIGHSLGAHVMGVAGNKMWEKRVPLPWITGLDPATIVDSKPANARLNPSSALFTSVIHTDPNRYGTKKELGLVNFWPNFRNLGPVVQPGCPVGNIPVFSDDDFCSHHRSWELFVDAMQNPGTLLGSYAKNFKTWKRYHQQEREATVLEVGVYNPYAVPGNYYFRTAAGTPYGLAKEGL